jgi:hypothetical protein
MTCPSLTCESTRWNACAWQKSASDWPATRAVRYCDRTSFGWRKYGPPWQIGVRAVIPQFIDPSRRAARFEPDAAIA